MSKTDVKNSNLNRSEDFLANLNLDRVLSKETQRQIKDQVTDPVTALAGDWAKEATEFIRKNPWAAVLGAAAIGYFLGASRRPGSGR